MLLEFVQALEWCVRQRTVRSQPFQSHSLTSIDMTASTVTRRHYSLYSRCSRSLVQLRGRTVDALGNLDSTYGLCTTRLDIKYVTR